jgi:hypothetical protein
MKEEGRQEEEGRAQRSAQAPSSDPPEQNRDYDVNSIPAPDSSQCFLPLSQVQIALLHSTIIRL